MNLVVDAPTVARLVIVVPKTVEVLQLLVDVGLSSSWTRLLTCRCCASGVWSWFQLIVQLLDEVVGVLDVVHVLVYGVMKTVEVPQLQLALGLSSTWTRLSTCLLLCTFLMLVEVPQVQFIDRVSSKLGRSY